MRSQLPEATDKPQLEPDERLGTAPQQPLLLSLPVALRRGVSWQDHVLLALTLYSRVLVEQPQPLALAEKCVRFGLAGQDANRIPGRLEADVVAAVGERRCNPKYLPQRPLPSGLAVSGDVTSTLEGAGFVLWAVPTQHLRAAARAVRAHLPTGAIHVSLAKGFEAGTLAGNLPHSSKLHVVERFTLNPATFELTRDIVAEDPEYFADKYVDSDSVLPADAPFRVEACKELAPEYQQPGRK